MHADLILVLEKGQVMQMGTHSDLIQETKGLYRRMSDIQTRIDEELEMSPQGSAFGQGPQTAGT